MANTVEFAVPVEKSGRYSPLHASTCTYHGEPWDIELYSYTQPLQLYISTSLHALHSTSLYTHPLHDRRP